MVEDIKFTLFFRKWSTCIPIFVV